ncbi:MAG: CDP-alcohol phosphatidyltransferase family protein [Burkholderiaceae bacterium]|nr:MAG: CDP-alcohol phosphatidyltransferase family protein [Burkholderiaceae bacterium]
MIDSRIASTIPLMLTALRALLGPVVVFLSLQKPDPAIFAVCLVLAFFSDVFDGILARKLGIATPTLRRLDSLADTIFYAAATYAVWKLYPTEITQHATALYILFFLEVARYLFDLLKFRREASYHMWSSKLWGVALFLGFFSLLVFRQDNLLVQAAIYIGIIADIEGLLISAVLPQWKNDVPTLFHAVRDSRNISLSKRSPDVA